VRGGGVIRKAVIVSLTIGAVAASALVVWSFFYPSLYYREHHGWYVRYLVGIDLRTGVPDRWVVHLGPGHVEVERCTPPHYRTTYTTLPPLWAVPFLLAAYPAIAFIRGPLRRWRRRRKGRCVRCGYDLTGNVAGVCPECGLGVGGKANH